MPKVVSILPAARFKTAKVALPAGWDFTFLDRHGEEDIISACRGADFLLVPAAYPPITARVLENIPSVRLVQSSGAGFDQIDTAAAARLDIPVANSPGQNAATVAEFTIGLLIVLQRRVLFADREIKKGNYRQTRENLLAKGLPEIRGARLGLVGCGLIGREVAKIAGFMGAEISYYDPVRLPKEAEAELRLNFLPLDELLAASEAISLHVPLNEQTRGLIGRREFNLMAPGTLLINTARGEVVDQAALAEALESGRLGGAAIDTLAPEPPSPEHPLLNLTEEASARLVLTPHLAGVTAGAFGRLLRGALANLERTAAGEPPQHVVNGVSKARFPR